jgi:hypothetical protein
MRLEKKRGETIWARVEPAVLRQEPEFVRMNVAMRSGYSFLFLFPGLQDSLFAFFGKDRKEEKPPPPLKIQDKGDRR